MERKWRGLLYGLLWYASILSGFLFIACPLLPLLLISPPIFRKCGELLFCCWEMYPTVLMEVFGMKVVVSGDHVRPNDSAILVMNHRTRVDWNFLWGAMYQACMPHVAAHKLKFVLKDPIRTEAQMNGFLFITRRWEEDRSRLSCSLDHLVLLHRRSQLLIFPEGTDLTANNKQRSDKYARSRGLPEYEYTLHPKTTGFTYLVRHLQQSDYLDAIYDLTIGYPDIVPQSEIDMLKGKVPDEVHFLIRRIAKNEVPRDEAGLRSWLEERWRIKEAELREFYVNKSFNAGKPWPQPSRLPLRLALIFWTFLSGLMLVLLVFSRTFQLWALCHALLFLGISSFSSSFMQLEVAWYQKWRSLLSAVVSDCPSAVDADGKID